MDDTIIEVHGHAKQGAGFGYSGVRGPNALLATVTTTGSAPLIVVQRLRKGSCGSPRGAKRLVADAVKQARSLLPSGARVLARKDSAFYGRAAVHAAAAGGADVTVTVRMDKAVKAAIATINDDVWTTIEYTDAVFDQTIERWISRAEVAEIAFTAFAAQEKADHVPGRLIVRRILDVHADQQEAAGQGALFDVGASTPSSPPPRPTFWTRSPRTRPTEATQSSNRSTPTSKAPHWRTCPQGACARAPAAQAVLIASAMRRAAPRPEMVLPLRSRAAAITGTQVGEDRAVSWALTPLTPE